jgi:hypothetical protein
MMTAAISVRYGFMRSLLEVEGGAVAKIRRRP